MRTMSIILAACLVGCSDEPGETPAAAHPRGAFIAFEQPNADLGSIADTGIATHTFKFTNDGDAPLEIVDFQTSCGCTRPSLSRTRFEPGESGVIDVEFDPKGSGRQSHWVQVFTNAENQPPQRLTVTATIVPLLTHSPRILRFGIVPLDGDQVRRVQVQSADGDLSVQTIRSRSPRLSVRMLDDPDADTSGYPFSKIVEVTLAGGGPWGSLVSGIDIDVVGTPHGSDTARTHSVGIIVSATVFGTITAEPDFIRVEVVRPGGSFSKEVLLTSREPFELLVATVEGSTMPGVTVSFEPFSFPGRYGFRLVISGDTGSYLGRIAGRVRIRTDRPGEEDLRIEFAGMVREPT